MATRAEIERFDRLLGLLRSELRASRYGDTSASLDAASGLLERLRAQPRAASDLVADYLRRRDAEQVLRQGHPSRFGQVLRELRRLTRGGRPPRRPTFLSAADGDGSMWAPLIGSDGPGTDLRRQLEEATRALAQRRALAVLLRGESRYARGGSPEDVPPADGEALEPALDPETLVPNEVMARSMVGRIHTVDLPLGPRPSTEEPQRQPSVTVAVRFHDPGEMASLERCLCSLEAQTGVDLTTLVMFQGSDEEALAMVERTLERVWLSEPQPRLVSVPNPDHADLRTTMLNRALDIHYEETTNDFFYVLDHDDVVFSHALATMAGPVVGTAAAVSFGKVLVARYLSLDGYDVLYRMDDHFKAEERDISEITIDNFCPFHSYVYHTRAMAPARLRFNESMDRLEDYEALLRVATTYPVYAGAISTLVGLYCWRGARAIAGPIEGSAVGERSAWERNRVLFAQTIREVVAQPAESR